MKEKSGTKSLGEKACEEMMELIRKQGWKAGDKLPNEYELAQILGVGRSTVREAIRTLISKNVLEIRRGLGTFVLGKSGLGDDPLGLSFIRDRFRLAQDLLEIRLLIEPRMAELSAQYASQQEIQALFSLAKEVERKLKNCEPHDREDVEFHTMLARSSGNVVVPNLIPVISQSIVVSIDLTDRTLRQETIDTHWEIVQAISEHNPSAAHDAMLLHLVYNRRRLSDRLQEKERESK